MTNFKRIFSIFLTTTFIMTSLVPVSRANAAELGAIMLPTPGIMVTTSPAFSPVMLKGLHIDPKDPLVFDFLVSKGEAVMDKDRYIKEVERLSRFFLASMTIPENELWVNLSPFEKEKISTDSLSRTEMGQHMLAQDYLLKQLTASMLYPEKKLGKEFWAKVYEQAKKQFGSVDMPVNTFNKVWILADTANAIEKDNAVFITDAHLKVMLEEDFLALKRNQGRISLNPVAAEERIAASNIIRQIILPEIEKEVNTGANFAPVRQIFNAFVLSTWYKKALKTAILNQVYADKSKMGGIESSDTAAKQKIYDQYIQAYKKGVFNYIKEETNDQQRRIPRKYFSGGMVVGAAGVKITAVDTVGFNAAINRNPGMDDARVRFQAEMNKLDLAMTTSTGMIEALYDAPRTSTTTKYIAMAERKAPALEAFLKKAGIEYTSYSKVKVKVQNQNMPFTAILQDGTVYLSSEFLKLLEESTSRFDFDRLGRELIQVVVSSSEKDRYWAQILWAREKLSKTKQLAKLIDIEGMIKEISAEFVGNQILETMTQELKDAVGPILAGSIQVQRELKLKDYTIAQEGTSKIIGALEKIVYQLAVNRMNGELIKYATPKVSKDDPSDVKDKDLKFQTLAFASNPVTLAHMILASFGASVITQSSQSLLLITKGDFRKLALMDSFPTRFPITDKFFRDLFGEKGIVSVMPQLDGDYGINGEEKMIPIVEINKAARSIKIVYGYGGDHFQSIDGYTKLSEQNKKDFLYYMRLPGYVKFLRILKEFANQGLSKYGERVNIDRSFFGGLASIKDTPIDLNFKGSITKDEIERAGFNWEIVSNRFVSNRWARLKGESELILIVGSDQHADMVNFFGAKVMAVIKDAESKVIWEVASKSEVRLKASYEINRDFIQTIAGDDFDQVWRILEVAKVRKVDVLLEYLESPEGKKLLDNNVSLDLIILPSALFAPKLDCVPKAFLQNEYFMTMRKMAEEAGEHYPIAEVQNVYTPRQGQPTDEQDRLRKRLIEVGNIKVYVNPGIDSIDISSTGIRKGIVRFFQTGIIDLNLFVFLPKSLLLQIFRPENRSYLEYLASMQGGTFPKALQYLNPMPSEEEKARRADIINKAISDLGEGYRIHFSTEIKEGKSVVSIINADEVEVMSVKYNVSQKYDTSVNRDVVTVHAEEIQRGDQNNRGEILKVLIKELNVAQTISDDAMAVGTDSKVDEYGDPIAIIGQTATESNLGGIEFNKDDLKLNVQKNDKGIEFAIDPRLLQQLRSDDFSGFKPTVLDITPMTISNPVLN